MLTFWITVLTSQNVSMYTLMENAASKSKAEIDTH
jgi:hypothetical protein